MSVADRRARFHELHAREGIFVMPNPWDVGSARLLASCGFEALATTSAGYAWLLGKDDHAVTRDELVAHVADLAAAVDVPLSVDSERCFGSDPAGVGETVRLLADAGAAGCSIEDWDQENGRIDDPGHATELVAAAVDAAHDRDDPLVLTARAENHLHGISDLDDTIARLVAFRAVGADCVYAPGLTDPAQIAAVVEAVDAPVNVLALPGAPSVGELQELGVRRVYVHIHARNLSSIAAYEITHDPKYREGGLRAGDFVAEAAGCFVVSDFRQRDIAAGGEGAREGRPGRVLRDARVARTGAGLARSGEVTGGWGQCRAERGSWRVVLGLLS
jgi:2-methylisocitrate lyase-like PEP mutase family enzyme